MNPIIIALFIYCAFTRTKSDISGIYDLGLIVSLYGNQLTVDMSPLSRPKAYGTYDTSTKTGVITFPDDKKYDISFDVANKQITFSNGAIWTKSGDHKQRIDIEGIYVYGLIVSLTGNELTVDMSPLSRPSAYGSYDINTKTGTLTFADDKKYDIRFDSINDEIIFDNNNNLVWIKSDITGCYDYGFVSLSANDNSLSADIPGRPKAYGTYDISTRRGQLTFPDAATYDIVFNTQNKQISYIVDGVSIAVWNKLTDQATCKLKVAQPTCEIPKIYSRETTTLTCSSNQESATGLNLLCYDPCNSGYISYTGFDCIEENCPSGYAVSTPLACLGTKYVKECHKECQEFLPWPLDSVCDVAKTVCDNVPYPDTYFKKLYTRKPSLPTECPSNYDILSVSGIDILCYKSCNYGYIDGGIICVCSPEKLWSDVNTFVSRYIKYYGTELVDVFSNILTPIKDLLQASATSIFTDPTKLLNVLSPYKSAINDVVSLVGSHITNNRRRRLLGNDVVIVFEIAWVSMHALIGGAHTIGFAFDGTDHYFYVTWCAGIQIDVEVGIGFSLGFFNNIDDVSGQAFVTTVGVDIPILYPMGVGIDAFLINSQFMSGYLGSGFSVGVSAGISPADFSMQFCETGPLAKIN